MLNRLRNKFTFPLAHLLHRMWDLLLKLLVLCEMLIICSCSIIYCGTVGDNESVRSCHTFDGDTILVQTIIWCAGKLKSIYFYIKFWFQVWLGWQDHQVGVNMGYSLEHYYIYAIKFLLNNYKLLLGLFQVIWNIPKVGDKSYIKMRATYLRFLCSSM